LERSGDYAKNRRVKGRRKAFERKEAFEVKSVKKYGTRKTCLGTLKKQERIGKEKAVWDRGPPESVVPIYGLW